MMKRKREWLHFQVRIDGQCEATCDGKPWTARYEIGIVESGKSRVFEGVFLKLIDAEGREWLGRDRFCFVKALRQQVELMRGEGIELSCAGLDPAWYVTGLSDGSGFGFLRGREKEGAFHVLDQPDNY